MSGFLHMILELENERGGADQSPFDGSADTTSAQIDTELTEISAKWAREVGAHFEQAVASRRVNAPPTLAFSGTILGKPAKVTVRLGMGLLEDLIHVYGIFGWHGLDAAIANIAEERAKDDPVKQFVAKTHRVVTEMVIIGLDRIERAGIAFARTRWTEAMEHLNSYIRMVREPRFPEDHNTRQFIDSDFGSMAVDDCAWFVKKRKEFNDAEKKMGQWPYSQGKDPASPFRSLWKNEEDKKTAALGQLSNAARLVGANSPALLLVLNDLQDDFGDDPGDIGLLAHTLYIKVRGLQDQTRQLLEGLRLGPITKKSLAFATTPSGQLQLLATGGLEEYLTGHLAKSEQQILLNEVMLNDLTHPVVVASALQAPSWERFVLGVHLRDMRAITERKVQDDAQFSRVWAFLTKAVALLSLIILAAALGPVALGAAPVGATAVVFILGAAPAVTFVALAMMAIEVTYSLSVQRAELSEEIRARLHHVAIGDPASLAAIGQLLSTRQAIATDLLQEVFLMALTAGASRIKRVAQALDLYGSIEDMKVLFAPLPASTPTNARP